MYMNTGIYIIKNILNNKIYIGSAINITRRWYRHKTDLNCKIHDNQKLQRAWNKYGKENFSFEILELVNDKTKLIEREQFYLDSILFASLDIKKFSLMGYNINPTAYSSLGRAHTEETKKKIGDGNRGKIVSDEARENLRKSHLGQVAWNKGLEYTEEQKVNFSSAQKKRFKEQGHHNQKIVIQYSITDDFIKEWKSVAEAAKSLGIDKSNICSVCNGKNRYKSTGGYKWKYKE